MSQAPSGFVDVPLPLACAICGHPWPDDCSCPHPTACRTCAQPLANPSTAAGYCSTLCFRIAPASAAH